MVTVFSRRVGVVWLGLRVEVWLDRVEIGVWDPDQGGIRETTGC